MSQLPDERSWSMKRQKDYKPRSDCTECNPNPPLQFLSFPYAPLTSEFGKAVVFFDDEWGDLSCSADPRCGKTASATDDESGR